MSDPTREALLRALFAEFGWPTREAQLRAGDRRLAWGDADNPEWIAAAERIRLAALPTTPAPDPREELERGTATFVAPTERDPAIVTESELRLLDGNR